MESIEYQNLISKTSGLKPNPLKAAIILTQVVGLTVASVLISLSYNPWIWFFGQVLFGFSVLQWFVLLHDFGHNYFFKSSRLNWIFGYFSSLFCLVPFAPWKWIHSQHHTWTGWHDLDPTQESTIPTEASPLKNTLANWSWRLGLPTLTLAFSFKNFWNLPRLFKLFPDPAKRFHFLFSILFIVLVFFSFAKWVPSFFHLWGLGYLIFLIISDPLLISQHVHIPQKFSQGSAVNPFSVKEQDQFTRTLIFPHWVSRYILLSFDRHTLHHVVPRLACYHLDGLDYQFSTSIHWKEWLVKAKQTPAEILLFSNNKETGLNL